MNQQYRCFALSPMEMQLHIFQGSQAVENPKDRFFSSYYNTLVVKCKTENTEERLTEIVLDTSFNHNSVLKAPITIIQDLQNKTLSKDKFFLRYTDNETQKSFQNRKLNRTF